MTPRPSDGPLVRAADARAALTRYHAGREQQVREAWYQQRDPTISPPPERYYWPARFMLHELAALGRVRLEGQRY